MKKRGSSKGLGNWPVREGDFVNEESVPSLV
jgi:hypothetical protein